VDRSFLVGVASWLGVIAALVAGAAVVGLARRSPTPEVSSVAASGLAKARATQPAPACSSVREMPAFAWPKESADSIVASPGAEGVRRTASLSISADAGAASAP
jgi:hypothetical protein